jgi:hypothetical protein
MTDRHVVGGPAGSRSRLAATTAELADEIIARDLPGLTTGQRDAAVRMVLTAVAGLPDSLRPGVAVAGFAVRSVRRWPAAGRAAAGLPVTGEYVRLVRGLAVAAACEVSLEHGGAP